MFLSSDLFISYAESYLKYAQDLPIWAISGDTNQPMFRVVNHPVTWDPQEENCRQGTEIRACVRYVPAVRLDGKFLIVFRITRPEVFQEEGSRISFVTDKIHWVETAKKILQAKGAMGFLTVIGDYSYEQQTNIPWSATPIGPLSHDFTAYEPLTP